MTVFVLLLCADASQVRDGLVPLISEMHEKGSPPDDAWLKGKYNTDTQVRGGGTHLDACTHVWVSGCKPASVLVVGRPCTAVTHQVRAPQVHFHVASESKASS